ncbi:MAG: iron dicitrate transport regulator FecR, partial [Alphaproteobacteria bacterium]|nr:iron dicitrate transport regulator FecR [Alphaproteobacteria bacterium]
GIVAFRSATGPTTPISLTVGEQLTHRDGQTDDRVARVDPNPAFGWTVEQLVYHDRPLSEVATDLSRRFGTRIRPADAATGRIRFTGVLVTDDEGAVLRRLEAFSGVTAERTTRGVVLRSHEPNR